jgi:hypothetical protein
MIDKLIALSRRRRNIWEQGAAAVEFAMTAPLLVALVLGVGDYGALMNGAASLVSASRAGAEVVKAKPSETSSQLNAFNPSLSPTGATFAVSGPSCTCVDGTTPSPLPTCPGSGSGNPCSGRVLKYMQISATQTVAPLFAITNFLYFGSFGSQTLTATTYIRIQ